MRLLENNQLQGGAGAVMLEAHWLTLLWCLSTSSNALFFTY